MVLVVALMLVGFAPQPERQLNQVVGIQLQDTEGSAMAHLRGFGDVTREVGPRGGVGLEAGPVTVTVCNGKVVHVSRELGNTFHEFAIFAQTWKKKRGSPEEPEIFAIDGGRPASHPGSPLKISASAIRLSWPDSPGYMLSYNELNGSNRVIEALNAPNECASWRGE